jgi:hypothetical protein
MIEPFGVRRQSRAEPVRRQPRSSLSREDIVGAIQRWVDLYGSAPVMLDWDPARARRQGHGWRAGRFEAGQWPTARVVCGAFGSFSAAVAQAGYVPRPAPSRVRANLAGPEDVLDAIREWVRRFGDVPSMADWDPARARRLKQDWRIARYHDGDWPSVRSVAHHFGSLSRAIEAAGLQPRAASSQRADRAQERAMNRRALALLAAAERRPGLVDLTSALRRLAGARKATDPVALHAALIDVASAALAWADATPVE